MEAPAPDRLIRLEEKITYLEHHLSQLDGVVRELADDQARLRRETSRLRDALAEHSLPSASTPTLEEERPPHY